MISRVWPLLETPYSKCRTVSTAPFHNSPADASRMNATPHRKSQSSCPARRLASRVTHQRPNPILILGVVKERATVEASESSCGESVLFPWGALNANPQPNGVTSISLVTSIHSKSGVSRQRIRTGSFSLETFPRFASKYVVHSSGGKRGVNDLLKRLASTARAFALR